MVSRRPAAWSRSTLPFLKASDKEPRRVSLASWVKSKILESAIIIFSGFLSFFKSFFKSVLIEDRRAEKFLRFDLIFAKLSPTSHIDLIKVSVSIKSNSFMDSSEE